MFLDKEFPASGPPDASRVVDLLARVPMHDTSGKAILVHIEIEARARPGMGERVRRYHHRIQTRHEGQILSIVLFLKGGEGGICEELMHSDLAGPGLTPFRYLSFGLAKCPAVDYLAKPEPLAWALAALMDCGGWSHARLKMSCLARIAEAPLNDQERHQLANCVETYLELTPEEATEFSLLATSQTRRTHAMSLLYKLSWADKMMMEGERRGIQGVICDQLEERFGSVPEEIRSRIQSIESVDRLNGSPGRYPPPSP